MVEIEIWKDIPGYEGLYQASNYGQIKRLIGWKCWKERILKQHNTREHKWLSLCKNNIHKKYYVHRLILSTFICPCPEGMEGCHNDGNPSNNFVGNLRWDTHKNNEKDKIKHGTMLCGSKMKQSKLNEQDVINIINRYIDGEYGTDIAKDYNMSFGKIYKILRQESWKHVR